MIGSSRLGLAVPSEELDPKRVIGYKVLASQSSGSVGTTVPCCSSHIRSAMFWRLLKPGDEPFGQWELPVTLTSHARLDLR